MSRRSYRTTLLGGAQTTLPDGGVNFDDTESGLLRALYPDDEHHHVFAHPNSGAAVLCADGSVSDVHTSDPPRTVPLIANIWHGIGAPLIPAQATLATAVPSRPLLHICPHTCGCLARNSKGETKRDTRRTVQTPRGLITHAERTNLHPNCDAACPARNKLHAARPTPAAHDDSRSALDGAYPASSHQRTSTINNSAAHAMVAMGNGPVGVGVQLTPANRSTSVLSASLVIGSDITYDHMLTIDPYCDDNKGKLLPEFDVIAAKMSERSLLHIDLAANCGFEKKPFDGVELPACVGDVPDAVCATYTTSLCELMYLQALDRMQTFSLRPVATPLDRTAFMTHSTASKVQLMTLATSNDVDCRAAAVPGKLFVPHVFHDVCSMLDQRGVESVNVFNYRDVDLSANTAAMMRLWKTDENGLETGITTRSDASAAASASSAAHSVAGESTECATSRVVGRNPFLTQKFAASPRSFFCLAAARKGVTSSAWNFRGVTSFTRLGSENLALPFINICYSGEVKWIAIEHTQRSAVIMLISAYLKDRDDKRDAFKKTNPVQQAAICELVLRTRSFCCSEAELTSAAIPFKCVLQKAGQIVIGDGTLLYMIVGHGQLIAIDETVNFVDATWFLGNARGLAQLQATVDATLKILADLRTGVNGASVSAASVSAACVGTALISTLIASLSPGWLIRWLRAIAKEAGRRIVGKRGRMDNETVVKSRQQWNVINKAVGAIITTMTDLNVLDAIDEWFARVRDLEAIESAQDAVDQDAILGIREMQDWRAAIADPTDASNDSHDADGQQVTTPSSAVQIVPQLSVRDVPITEHSRLAPPAHVAFFRHLACVRVAPLFDDHHVAGPIGMRDAGFYIVSAKTTNNNCLLFCLTAVHEQAAATLQEHILESATHHFGRTRAVTSAVLAALTESYDAAKKAAEAWLADTKTQRVAAQKTLDDVEAKLRGVETLCAKLSTRGGGVASPAEAEAMVDAYRRHIYGGAYKGGHDVTVLNYHSALPDRASAYGAVQTYMIERGGSNGARLWPGVSALGRHPGVSPRKTAYLVRTANHFNLMYHVLGDAVTIVNEHLTAEQMTQRLCLPTWPPVREHMTVE